MRDDAGDARPPSLRSLADRPAAPRLRRGRRRQRAGGAQPRRRAAAAHRRHRRRAHGRRRRGRILEDLAWLELEWTPAAVRQSARREQHVAAAERLLATTHAYRCFCPPSEERYGGRCRALPRADAERRHDAGEPSVVRFRVPPADVVVEDATRGPVRFGARRDLRLRARARRMAARPSISRPRSTITTSRSRTSCAARITSPTRRAICCCCARSGRRRARVRPLPDHRRPRRRAALDAPGGGSARGLRARGVPPEAIVAFAAQLACPAQDGAPEVAPFAELAQRFSLARLGTRDGARRPRAPGLDGAQRARAAPARGARPPARAVPAAPTRQTVTCSRHSQRPLAGHRRSPTSPTRPRHWHRRPRAPRRIRPALPLFRELREADLREHLPYAAAVALIDGLRALGQSRGLSPARRATPPENRAHGRGRTACRSRWWPRCCHAWQSLERCRT